MHRILTACVVAGTMLFVSRSMSFAGEELDKNDPLLKALRELKLEINQLREDIHGLSAVSPAQSKTVKSRRPVRRPAPKKTTSQVVSSTATGQPAAARGKQPKSVLWSHQSLRRPASPAVRDAKWVRDDLDRFVLAKLEQAGLKPSPDADRFTLLRRVAIDLTGLPPTETEIRDFVNDDAPIEMALARVVDRYLRSARFGERWGRHWLDVVRYADSVGRTWNAPFTYAWRYRDYVIDSFNADKPFDQFVTEQLAGDLLPAKDLAARREQQIATGFLALGPLDIIEPEGEALMMDRVDEQIDVTTRALLGLTVACARCHDHKYEPITMRDYYALAGIFYSMRTYSGQRRGNYVSSDDLLLLPSKDGRKLPIAGVHSMADITYEHRNRGYRKIFWTTDPNLAMGVSEGRINDCPIRIDGQAWKRGPVPPRGDFRLAGLNGLKGIPRTSSGRLELAKWITSSKNPLTARVMVNRIWQHLMGRGLVRTVDNFGSTGEKPTHPALLDHLAVRFQSKWSVKSMIRAIVLSRTYRQSSAGQASGRKIDPQNRLYWRMSLRRLEVEALRDSMLDVAGRLTLRRPDGIQIAGTGGKGRWARTRSLLTIDSPYRTVYLPVLRSLLPEMYTTFDFPNPTQVKGRRDVTTVAPQALFLLNSRFAVGCASDTAKRLLGTQAADDAGRVSQAYLRLLNRRPDQQETAAAISFLRSLRPPGDVRDFEQYRWTAFVQALMTTAEFRSVR